MATCLSAASAKGEDLSTAKLHLLTYLHPGYPVELFQVYRQYFEEVLKCGSYLSVETRWSGPPADRVDPFTANEIDLAFMCSSCFVRMVDSFNSYVELLPVVPLYDHKKADKRPFYFSEVIARKEKLEKYKSFADLNGHRWATNDEESLRGNVPMLAQLRENGVNASFFGTLIHAQSQIECINLAIANTVDATAVDSTVLELWLKDNPQYKDEIDILCSWGPYPMPPIVINSRLSADIKDKLANSLLRAMEHEVYGDLFRSFGIKGFERVDIEYYDRTRRVMECAKGESLYPAYY